MLVLASSFLFVGCGEKDSVISGLRTEKEANEILVSLKTAGITATKKFTSDDKGGSWSIHTSRQNEVAAINIITSQGYPKEENIDVFKAFSSNGLMRAPQDDQAKYQRMLELQLANTLKNFEGVLDAEVNISVNQNMMIGDSMYSRRLQNPKLKASVYIKHSGTFDDPGSQNISKIKKLVASRIIGLEVENVYVILDRPKESFISGKSAVYISRAYDNEVQVLGLRINSQSMFVFRIIMISFIILLLVTTMSLVFLIWKLLPTIRKNWRKVLSLKQIDDKDYSEDNDDSSEVKSEEKTSKEDSTPDTSKKNDDKEEDLEKEPKLDKSNDIEDEQKDGGSIKNNTPKKNESYEDIDDEDIGI